MPSQVNSNLLEKESKLDVAPKEDKQPVPLTPEEIHQRVNDIIDLIPSTRREDGTEEPLSIINMAKNTVRAFNNLSLQAAQAWQEGRQSTTEETFKNVLDLGLGTGAVASHMMPAGAAGIFGSTLAKKDLRRGLLTSAQIDASEMARAGATEAEILQKTGLSKDAVGNWVYEIDDSKSNFFQGVIEEGSSYRLHQVYDHPDLYDIYPEVKNILFRLASEKELKGALADFTPSVSVIPRVAGRLRMGVHVPPEQQREVMLHELQHAVQWADYVREPNNKFSRWTEARKQYSEIAKDLDKALSENQSRWSGPEPIIRELLRAIDNGSIDPMSSLEKLEQEIYLRDRTEFEARNTATRRDMTSKERRQISPKKTEDLPRNEIY